MPASGLSLTHCLSLPVSNTDVHHACLRRLLVCALPSRCVAYAAGLLLVLPPPRHPNTRVHAQRTSPPEYNLTTTSLAHLRAALPARGEPSSGRCSPRLCGRRVRVRNSKSWRSSPRGGELGARLPPAPPRRRPPAALLLHSSMSASSPSPSPPSTSQALEPLSPSVSSRSASLYFGSMHANTQPGQQVSKQSGWSCPDACLRWP